MNSIHERYQRWTGEPTLPEYLKHELIEIAGNSTEIEERFHTHLSFGTGGMRGLLGAGINRINIYTIRRVAEGLALLIKKAGQAAMNQGVVIAYDTRHYSKTFAEEVAETIGKSGIKVFLFKESRPTPELSYAIRHFNTYAGVMITASHNPAAYNGIKVYGEDGGQLSLAPTEKLVQNINCIKDLFSIRTTNKEVLLVKGILTSILEEVDSAYEKSLLTLNENIEVIEKHSNNLSIVYTPLHGSGLVPVTTGLRAFGFKNVHVVNEQADPNPAFPTVSSPNPEEREAFELAIQLGHSTHADLLLATDPDADRLGVAVRNGNGEFELLNGNQIGALLLNYILSQKVEKDELPSNGVILKTIVTSEFGRAIASKFGVHTIDTLTGFKFISEKIESFQRSGQYSFLFGYEESYGYLIGDFVRDKDAVQVALLTSEMAAYYKSHGQNLNDVLLDLYDEFGYYQESLTSLTRMGLDGQAEISRIMAMFRNNPPQFLGGVPVVLIEDYKAQIRRNVDGLTEQLTLPAADVLKLLLEDGSWVCIRPSGTEPKCKFYFGVMKDSLEEANATLREIEHAVMRRVKNSS